MKEYVVIGIDRGHYSAGQVVDAKRLTAGELRDCLADVEDDAAVVIYMGGYGVTHFAGTNAFVEELDEEEE